MQKANTSKTNENIPMKNNEESQQNSLGKICKYCGKPYKEYFDSFSNKTFMISNCNCEKKLEQKQKGLETIALIKSIRNNSGIGKRYLKKTFSNYNKSINKKAVDECLDYCRNFIDNYVEGKGLFLMGTIGTGKTHLLAAIIDYIARIYKKEIRKVMYFTSTGLLNEIRNSYNKSEEFVHKVKNCSLLLIDDFGAEKTTDWVLETYFEIIDYRYSNLLPTIIATNLTDKEIKEKLSERIMSRIYEVNKGIKLVGKDYRLEIVIKEG